MKKTTVSIYSIIHFIVDLACAILVTNLVMQKMGMGIHLLIAVIIYNFFAFAMQLPIGIIADKVNKNALCSAIGCVIVALSFCFANYGIVACLVSGIGNALFHVGGGIDVLNISDKKASLSGIYVSTGSMGIFLGGKSASIGFNQYYLVMLVLMISALALLWLYNKLKDRAEYQNEEIIFPVLNKTEILIIVCLMITVVIRGYIGLILAFEWKSNFVLALISIFAVIFGKMLGGIIGDRIGFLKVSLISLIVSAILYIFAFSNSVCGILAILFFNMTMPITLTALSNILFNNKGMAFGLLTFALFIGAAPVLFGYTKALFSPVGLCITSLVSAVVLFIGIKNYNTIMEKKND